MVFQHAKTQVIPSFGGGYALDYQKVEYVARTLEVEWSEPLWQQIRVCEEAVGKALRSMKD